MAVVGSDGRPLGKLEGIRYDPATRQPAYLLVRFPGFFGLGAVTRLVPAAWVRDVAPDQIRVAATRDTFAGCPPLRADVDIREDVLAAIEQVSVLRPFRLAIQVDVKDGIVELSGHVRNKEHRRLAEAAARSVPGVLDVRNALYDDDTLTYRVADALTRDDETRLAHLRVSCYLGTVRLDGTVPSEAARQKATELARSVPGVRAVDNGAVVSAEAPAPAATRAVPEPPPVAPVAPMTPATPAKAA
jgi:osmotically-inducible protein OsmY